MNKKDFSDNKNLMAAGVLTAISASLCCITPVLGILGGIGGVASIFSWLEPYRLDMISLTTLLLGFAWYQKFKPKTKDEIGCECETNENPSFLQSKLFLSIVTVLAGILISFPYYSGVFFSSLDADTIIVERENLATVQIKIEGMTCSGCEHSVNKAIRKLAGVLDVTSNHITGLVKIKYDKSKVSSGEFKNVIENTVGFTVSNISKGE